MLALDYIEKDGSDGNQGILHRARRTARQMEELTEELLAYARLTSGREDTEGPELVPLGPLLERVVGRLELLTRERGGEIEIGPMPVVWGNEVLLRQVARNLLVNALRYSEADVPGVRIWSETEPARHVIRFGDNGRGIAAEDRERIFEAFFRRATEVTGTGLGLALCREAMARQGGEIWLESSGPDGSVFAVALPRPPEPSSVPGDEPG
jgi:signal transduction histidine kinase